MITPETSPPVGQVELSPPLVPPHFAVQLLLARGCFSISSILSAVILARGLGPIEYGVYGVIISVLTWIELVASMGISAATARLIPDYHQQTAPLEQTARTLVVIISLFLFILLWLLAPEFAQIFNIPTGTILFRLAIADIPLGGLYFVYQGTLYGHQRFGTISVVLVNFSLLKFLAVLWLSIFGLSLPAALVANIVATLFIVIYLLIKVPPSWEWPVYSMVKPLLFIGFPIGIYLVASQVLLNLDLWCLKSLWKGNQDTIGIYVAGLNISRTLLLVPNALSGPLFVLISSALTREDRESASHQLQAVCRLALILLLPACLLLAIDAESVLTLFFSRVYAFGGTYLRIQVLALGLMAFFDFFYNALMAAGRYFQSAAILLTLVTIALLSNFQLISAFGPIGACLSLMLTISLGTVAGGVLVYRHYGSFFRLQTITRILIASSLIAIASLQITATGPWLFFKFALLFGFYGLILTLLKELSLKDLKALSLQPRTQYK